MSDEHPTETFEKDALLSILSEAEKLAHVGGWEWDIRKDVWTFSDNWLRLHGCSKRHLVTADLLTIAHPDDRDTIQKAFAKAVAEGVDYNIEHRIIRQDSGEVRNILVSGKTILDNQNKPVKLYGAAQDITEHRRTEEDLRISEQKFRSLAENVPGLVLKYKLNPDGSDELLYISKSVEDIFEVSQEDAFTNNTLLWDRIHEDDLEDYTKSVQASAENLSLWEQEHRLQLPGNRIKWLYTRGVPLQQDDASIIWDTIALDITGQKKTEALLKENEQRYKSAQRIGNVGNWEYDFVTETFWGSEQAKRIYGLDPHSDRFSTDEVENCIPERERVHQALVDLLEKDKPYNLEFDIHPISGPDTRTIQSRAEVRRDEAGNPVKVIGVVQDITEQKKSAEQKEKLEKVLLQSQKMESIGTLAGGIAHEFNNILSIIIGNNELIMEDLPDSSLSRENCDEIRLAGLRARDIVRHLLIFSQQDDSAKKPIEMGSIVKESLQLIRATTPTNINIVENISAERFPVLGDPSQINQILINLCTNAFHALPISGGRVDIELCNTTINQGSTPLSKSVDPGHYVCLQVRDNGSGIDNESLERVFEPFYTTKEVNEGRGIGLSVVHGIVENHGGSIACESAQGGGTTFTILIPAHEGPADEESEKETCSPGSGACILFIDDEPSIAKLGKLHLESFGYEVYSTTDPAEALDLIHAEPDRFDLVISDMAMPNMPGDQLVAEIFAAKPEMPAIICTGYSSRISEKKASEIGVKALLMKPLDKTELVGTVRKVLNEVSE